MRDPLRDARRAVRAGRFAHAGGLLDALPASERDRPEWYLLRAMVQWRLGAFAASRRTAGLARRGFREAGDLDGEMRAENVAAAGAFALGDLDDAERGFGRAQDLARRLGDEVLAARCANNLGNIAFYLARHDDARSHYRTANAEFDRLAFTHGLAETWINLGILARDLRDMDGAFEAADRALGEAARARQPRLLAQALVSRGEAAAALGDPVLGRAQTDRGLELARAEQDRLAEAEALRVLAGIALDDDRLDEAHALHADALAVARAIRHPWAIAEIQRDRGRVLTALGRRSEATQALSEAADQFLRLGSIPRAEQLRAEAERLGDASLS